MCNTKSTDKNGKVWNQRLYDDIDYIVLWSELNEAVLDFVIIEIAGRGTCEDGTPYYEFGNGGVGYTKNSIDDTVWDVPETDLISASVKFDGCSHFNFQPDDGAYHLCGYHNYKEFCELIMRVWGIAEEHFDYLTQEKQERERNSQNV